MNDILFENREKRYGAYFIRKCQPWHEWIALAIVCNVMGFVILTQQLTKEEKVVQEKRRISITCPPLHPPTKTYEINLLPPCPPSQKKPLMVRMPVPVPAWKLCECDYDKKLSPKPLPKSIQEITPQALLHDIEDKIKARGDDWICYCVYPQLEIQSPEVTTDSSLFAVQKSTFNADALLIKPDVFPKRLLKQLQKGKMEIRVSIDSSGKYREHELTGKYSKTFAKKLAKALPQLRFTPAIAAGEPTQAWISLTPDLF